MSSPLFQDRKYDDLMRLSSKEPTVRLSDVQFQQLVQKKAKNFTAVVMFTALGEQYGCGVCKSVDSIMTRNINFFCVFEFRDAYEEFQTVATSHWRQYQKNPSIFFSLLDVDTSRSTFEQVYPSDHCMYTFVRTYKA